MLTNAAVPCRYADHPMTNYHRRFFSLVDHIETTFPVADWRVGDVPVWPLARTALYSNIYLQGAGREPALVTRRNGLASRIGSAVADVATPIVNIWRSRGDLRHVVLAPRRASALFLGDGSSLDRVNGAWRDRFCDPLINQMHACGASTLLMQRGNLPRVPASRPTFAANTIVHWGRVLAGLRLSAGPAASLAEHESVLKFLGQNAVSTFGLSEASLSDRARAVSATALAFEQVLKIVRPELCFMVGYFWGMGHALALACRRRGVLSIDLQREGRSAEHEAYRWSAVPEDGYAILPAVFWTWTQADAAAIETWTRRLKRPWHRSIHGGHPQLSTWFDDNHPETRAADARISEIREAAPAEREILVTLQVLTGYEDEWKALAGFIEASPPRWRWWLRLHPNTSDPEDRGMGRIPALRRPNVVMDLPSSLPLPAVLRQMDVLVTATSGAAVDASMFGVRSLFLSPVARDLHPHLFETGHAEIVPDMNTLEQRLLNLPRNTKTHVVQPDLSETLSRLAAMAEGYRELCLGARPASE